MHILYYLAIILLAGLVMARLVSFIKLPHVTGYLLSGIIIGPFLLNLVPANAADQLSIISEVALGFIAYSIGSEFNYKHLKKLGKGIILITFFEAIGAVIIVNLTMFFIFKQSLPFSLVLGSIAAATAPAATIMVIRQYKAKGPLVNTLLPIVAIDDAVGIIVFGISINIARSLLGIGENISPIRVILAPLWEIFLAVIVGFIIGIFLSFLSKKAKGDDQQLTITIVAIFLTVGISHFLNISPLLSSMALGATVVNLIYNNQRVLSVIDRITPPIYIAFFTIAGIDLNISMLKGVGLIGIGYILARVLGKVLGASIGSALAKMPKTVQKYLGFTLIPQAGVAIGLAMLVDSIIPEFGSKIKVIILAATVVYELIGPVMTKMAIYKAGEVPTDKI